MQLLMTLKRYRKIGKKCDNMAKHQYLKLGAVIVVAGLIVMAGAWVLFGGQIPTVPATGYQYTTQQACVAAGGTWTNGQCEFKPQPTGYVPFVLQTVYMKVMNALDKDATFGATDAYVRIYSFGKFDFTGPYLDSGSNAATTGIVNFSNAAMHTGTSYTYLAYQGDGGTNLYALKDDFTIPQLTGDKTIWTLGEIVYMYTEGAFTESALDSATAAFDESGDAVTLNKTAETVQGCLSWDFTLSNSVSGSILKEPVIVFEDSASSPLTDINDIEEIYLSVKSGSGVSFPSGNLVSEFRTATPVHVAPDEELGSADGITGTLKICLPAAEADVGTGSFLMHFDDLGDYRNRDLDNDVRAADETTTFTINT